MPTSTSLSLHFHQLYQSHILIIQEAHNTVVYGYSRYGLGQLDEFLMLQIIDSLADVLLYIGTSI